MPPTTTRRTIGPIAIMADSRNDKAKATLFELARKNLDGGACHVDVVVVLGPGQQEVAAGQVGGDLAAGPAGEDAGDADGAGAGAAGESLAGAALPDT